MNMIRTLPIDYFTTYERRSKELIVDRLTPIVEAAKVAEGRNGELSKKYDERTLDANTVNELIATNRGLTGLGAALIVVVDNCQYEFFSFLGQKCGLSALAQKDVLLSKGPDFSGQPWANVIRCAANYVRHASEWLEKLRLKEASSGDPDFWDKVSTDMTFVTAQFGAGSGPAQTIGTLVGCGVTLDVLIDEYLLRYFDVAKLLGLTSLDQVGTLFQQWVGSVKDHFRQNGF